MSSFLFAVAEDIYKKFGPDLSRCAVIFNNKRPMVYLKKHLAQVAQRTLWSPKMFTIGDFIETTTTDQPVSFIHRFFVLWQAYNELLQENNQNPLSADQFLPLAETILSDFDQLDFELIDPDILYKELRDIAAINLQFETLSLEQKAYLAGFWEGFAENKKNTLQEKFLELWSLLPRLYKSYKSGMQQRTWTDTATCYRKLVEEKANAEILFQQFDQFIFVGFNALSKCEQVLFQRWQQADKAVFYFDADQHYLEDPMQEAGMFLRRNMKETGLKQAIEPIPALLTNPDKQLKIYPVEGKIAQAKALSMLFREKPETATGLPATQAIILADESLLVPVIESLPDTHKLNITMGFPFKNSPLFSLVELWLNVREALMQSPTSIPLSLLDNYYAHPFISGSKPVEFQTLDPASEIPLQALHISAADTLFFKNFKDSSETLSGLRLFLNELFERRKGSNELSSIDAALIIQLIEVINILESQLLQFPELNKPAVLLPFLKKNCARLSAPIEGAPLEGLQIMGMLESRCLDFDEVYILGANEGILPGLSLSPTLIPDSLRRAFGLPVLQNQDALSAYLFYRLLQGSTTIHVFYDSLIGNHSSGEKSRFLAQLEFECPNLNISHHPQHQPVILPKYQPAQMRIPASETVNKKLAVYLEPSETGLSASALKLYLECPLRFYLKYIARIREPETGKTPLAPAEIGNALHTVMNRFYQPYLGKEVRSEMIQHRMDILPQLCEKAVTTGIYYAAGNNEHSSTSLVAMRIVETYARLFLEYDMQQAAPFRILGLEEKMHYSLPIQVQGVQQQVRLYAVIDRIDEVNGHIRIVDYKTGSDALTMNSTATLFDSDTKKGNPAIFQVLLYCSIYTGMRNRSALPYLYSYQWLRKQGAFPGRGEAEKFVPYTPEEMQAILTEFQTELTRLLEELFSSETEFAHNPQSTFCAKTPYVDFCSL